MISSVKYSWHLSLHFFDRMLTQSWNFYENNIILWYYKIWAKEVWKVVHGLIATTKTKKHYHNEKIACHFSLQHIITKTM